MFYWPYNAPLHFLRSLLTANDISYSVAARNSTAAHRKIKRHNAAKRKHRKN